MISRNGKGGGLAAHYDWIALAVGVLVLIGGAVFYVTSAGGDSDAAAAEAVGRLNRMKPAEVGVSSVDMTALQAVAAGVRNQFSWRRSRRSRKAFSRASAASSASAARRFPAT